jgi:citrate lyase subunit beta-like protein
VLPKVESVKDVLFVLEKVRYHRTSIDHPFPPISLILSIESANSLLQMPKIIELYQDALNLLEDSQEAPAIVSALLFAR